MIANNVGGLRVLYRGHGILALAFYLVGLAACGCAFYSNWWVGKVEGAAWVAMSGMTAFIALRITAQVARVGGGR